MGLLCLSESSRVMQRSLLVLPRFVVRRREARVFLPLTMRSPIQSTITRSYCEEKPATAIPKVKEEEISDAARSVADRILKMDFISICQFMDLLKERTGIDPNALGAMAGGGGSGGGAAATEAAAEQADTGFRKVTIREFTGGTLPVKEKFSIMKMMRAEQPDLSLADCKQRLDKAPCVIFDKIEKAKAEDIVDQLKDMPMVLMSEIV